MLLARGSSSWLLPVSSSSAWPMVYSLVATYRHRRFLQNCQCLLPRDIPSVREEYSRDFIDLRLERNLTAFSLLLSCTSELGSKALFPSWMCSTRLIFVALLVHFCSSLNMHVSLFLWKYRQQLTAFPTGAVHRSKSCLFLMLLPAFLQLGVAFSLLIAAQRAHGVTLRFSSISLQHCFPRQTSYYLSPVTFLYFIEAYFTKL